MSDEKALLAAIWEHPHDDTVRLAYSDWLQENGQPDRAEFIRVQCELARLTGDDPRYDALEAREEALRGAWEKMWWKAMPTGAKRGRFGRGFAIPDLGQFSISGLVKLGEPRLRAAPLWRYHYGVYGADLDALLGWPYLHRLELFALRPPLPDEWAERLAGCPGARNVTELALIDSPVTARDLTVLLDAWADRSLRDVSVKLDADGLRVLAAHPTTEKLHHLQIVSSGLTADSLALLTGSRYLTGLLSLSLGYNNFGDAGLAELLRWRGLPRLRRLSVNRTQLTDVGVEALAACPAAVNLRWLWLSSNPIEAAGALAIVAAPHLRNLKRVSFYGTPALGMPGVETALRRRFGRGKY